MKKAVSVLLAAALTLLCCACNMRGSIVAFDLYDPEKLYNTYTAILDGSLKVSVDRTETIPELRTALVQTPDYYQNMATLYFYNESKYHVTVYGYAWIAEQSHPQDASKAIYFNTEKKVANSSYKIRIDPGNNTYLIYELLNGKEYTATEDAIYFLFFRYEETEYVGASTGNDFIFWPASQTVD